MTVHRTESALLTSWFHKETWTGQLLSFYSFCPRQWKESLLKGYKTRVVRLCSPVFLEQALRELNDVFRNNGYPEDFVKQFFDHYQPLPPRGTSVTVPKKPVYITLPFMGDNRSQWIVTRIKQSFERTYPTCRLIVRTKVCPMFVSKTKDRLGIDKQVGVIYQFTCDCGDDYVGRTGQQLSARIKQHCPKWSWTGNRCRPRSKRLPQSAITRHVMSCQRFTGLPTDHFKIIQRSHSTTMRKILEALEIKSRQPCLCGQKEKLYDLKIPWF